MDGFLSLFPSDPQHAFQPLTAPFIVRIRYQPPFQQFWTHFAEPFVFSPQQPLPERPHLFAGAYQTWLFFGVLEEFFGRGPSQYEDFIERGSIQLKTGASDGKFRSWQQKISRLGTTQRATEYKRIKNLLRQANEASEELDAHATRTFGGNALLQMMSLSVKLLIAILHAITEDSFRPAARSGWWPKWLNPFATSDRTNVLKMSVDQARLHLQGRTDIALALVPGERGTNPATRLLLSSLMRNGWCFHRAMQACGQFEFVTLNYLASMRLQDKSIRGHAGCYQAGRCIAYDVTELGRQAARPRHVEGCSGFMCSEIGLPIEDLEKPITNERIPLVSISEKGTKLDIQVVKARSTTAYTAISHVWSDGMGNPFANQLPACQILRLRDWILELKRLRKGKPRSISKPSTWLPLFRSESTGWMQLWYDRPTRPGKPIELGKRGRVVFWMDTLCIPTSAETQSFKNTDRRKALKQKAIKHITPIFAGATNVLILDKGLQNVKTHHQYSEMSSTQLAAYIYSTQWIHRAWTLEEGSLAHFTAIRFGTMTIPVDLAIDKSARKDRSPLHRAQMLANRVLPRLVRDILADDQRRLSGESIGRKEKRLVPLLQNAYFISNWNSLRERELTHASDAFIIFANSLGFSIVCAMSMHDEERIPLLVASSERLPLSLMFNTGPRLSQPQQNAWIPTSFKGSDPLCGVASLRRLPDPRRQSSEVSKLRARFQLEEAFNLHILLLETPASDVTTKTIAISGAVDLEYCTIQRLAQEVDRTTSFNVAGTAPHRKCLIFDSITGSRSLRGYYARGAQYHIMEMSSSEVLLQYEMPIVVWREKQWYYRCQELDQDPSLDRFEARVLITKDMHVFVEFGESRLTNARLC